MQKKTLTLQPSFYNESPYAKYIANEEHDDSYGLIYYEFLHEIGTLLEVDIIFDQLNATNWLIADNSHMQIVYHKDAENNDQIEFIPKTMAGEQAIQKMEEELLQDNSSYLTFD
ncbi:hypothetical protein [Alkalihalobacterium chitinilyticum]|uniref:Uncharacterized protein n=1 Tax=Alkalihalobacterium chitinilyticum TaxID=2980103 RepID=A0ABT5VGS3_9BACI|nr:hypothetical protein [Alkalihalobacterium chitinilyticum]MDE5413399.1 hypothetical protein [Alkalihalobacterium chitinilyticum]